MRPLHGHQPSFVEEAELTARLDGTAKQSKLKKIGTTADGLLFTRPKRKRIQYAGRSQHRHTWPARWPFPAGSVLAASPDTAVYLMSRLCVFYSPLPHDFRPLSRLPFFFFFGTDRRAVIGLTVLRGNHRYEDPGRFFQFFPY